MRASLSDKAPTLLLLLASAVLAAAFSLPIGAERRASTQYERLEGFVGSFDLSRASEAAAKAANPAQNETLGLLAQAVRQRYTPIEANALISRVEQMAKENGEKAIPAPRDGARKPTVPVAPVAVAASSGTVKSEPGPVANSEASVPETTDSVGESYENDPAKYSLDASAARDAVTLRLRGLSREGRRYTLKVAVSNRGGEDFFVRELALRDGQEAIASNSFIRLFVEPGRTREGFVVFEKPRNGAAVHVALKEDREKGRVVELAVPYPF